MKWTYGNAWEKYPIERGELWREQKTRSAAMVWDIFDGLPEFMREADLVYCDPPWNAVNFSAFYTKAGMETCRGYGDFVEVFFDHICEIAPRACYVEVGKQNLELFTSKLAAIYPHVQRWEVVYYRKNPSFLLRGGPTPTSADFTGLDDMDTPRAAMQTETFECVADLCMGRGLTGLTAFHLGKRFVGTELNKRRLAVLIDNITRLGGCFVKEAMIRARSIPFCAT